MKYAIISDIHGNFPAFQAVIKDAKIQGAEHFLILGDYFLDLPYPNEVANALKTLDNAHIIRGNKEEYFDSIDFDESTWIHEQLSPLYWNCREFTNENLSYIRNLPPEIKFRGTSGEYLHLFHSAKTIFSGTSLMRLGSGRFFYKMKDKPFTHQQYLNYINDLFSKDNTLSNRLSELPDGAYLFGHSHLQWHWKSQGKLILNPGSCGMPLDFDTRAPYTLIEYANNDFTIEERRIEYNLTKTISDLKASSLYRSAPIWSRMTIESLKTGEERVSFLLHEAEKATRLLDEPPTPLFSNRVWRVASKVYWRD